MRSTECYSYFEIRSDGYFDFDKGYIASPNSDFNPEYISEKLIIEPHKIVKMGAARESGIGKYPFTKWIFSWFYRCTSPMNLIIFLCGNCVRSLS